MRYSRIFAALDGGTTQKAVAQRAVALAVANESDLMFGHVVDSVPSEASGTDFSVLSAEGLKRIERDLADVLREARDNPALASVGVEVRAGGVIETLTDELITPFAPDLVVCGERGLSAIKYAFMGSVSTFLIRNMRCDVLVVKQR